MGAGSAADMHEAFFVLAGTGTFELDGRPHQVRAGTLLHVPSGTSHSGRAGEAGMRLAYFGVVEDGEVCGT